MQAKKYVSAEQIAGKFGISVRTVYRDVKALGEQGVPVGFVQGKGYFVVQGYFLPPVSFTTDEANALLLIEQLVRGFSDNSIRKQYASALAKVRSVLHSKQKETLENLDENIRLQLPSRLNHDFSYLSALQQAISAKTLIRLDYCSISGETSRRVAEPIGLVFYAFSWHLIAWCHLRRDYRDFKISRILEVRPLDLPFEKADHISMNDYMKMLPVDY
jgi:predicted DNA-binding transcriptional regulator YafY